MTGVLGEAVTFRLISAQVQSGPEAEKPTSETLTV